MTMKHLGPSVSNARMAEILEGAADQLDLCPWGQGIGRELEGQICAEDALWTSITGLGSWAEALLFLKQYGTAPDGSLTRSPQWWENFNVTNYVGARYLDGRSVWGWNDEAGRTKDEVVELFRVAAKDLRNEAAPE